MKKMKYIIQLLRPAQWIKSGFVFLPVFFSGNLTNTSLWLPAIYAFFIFSFAASSVYCLNDIMDVESDRRHPRKCHRPVAAGKISVEGAIITMAVLICLSLSAAFFLGGIAAFATVGTYLILNVLYCLKLKQIAIIDVFIISLGFVLRLFLGGIMCGITLSPWIVCMTFLLALFLAFAKRRDDVVIYRDTGTVTRSNTLDYNLSFLNSTLGVIASVTIVCYIMYTISPEVTHRLRSDYVYVTSVFVLAGVIRYLQQTTVREKSGSPTHLLMHDRFIQLCVLFWILTFVVLIYG